MMDFILQRTKAFAAAFISGLVPLLINSFQTSSGFHIPTDWQTWAQTLVAGFVGGMIVHNAPNKSVSQ